MERGMDESSIAEPNLRLMKTSSLIEKSDCLLCGPNAGLLYVCHSLLRQAHSII